MKDGNPRIVQFSDTTLRDGEQMPGASLDPDAKVRIAKALAEARVAVIDAGFPACASDEIVAIQRIVREVQGPIISALCRTVNVDIDKAWEALAYASPDKRAASLFVATSPLHREQKLRRGIPELLRTICESIEYARQKFHFVSFSPEDASRTESDVLCEVYREAIDAGATAVGFPDTVGVLLPDGVRDAVRRIQDQVPNIDKAILVGHFHNDLGMATCNALAALREGVAVIQCTVNGIGERAGNTAFEEVVMAIALHGEAMGLATPIHTSKLWPLSQLVAELTGIPIPVNKAVVGGNVFATEAGIHQDGLLKHPDTYLPFRPERIGAPPLRLVLGKHSGRAAIMDHLGKLGIVVDGYELDAVASLARAASKEAWGNVDALLTSVVAKVRAKQSPANANQQQSA